LKKDRSQRGHTVTQRELEFPRHGGARPGAGRKPKGRVAGASHSARPTISPRHPQLVTQRLCAGLPSLRKLAEFEVLRDAIAAASGRDGFRIVHFSAQSNHVHYICEARDVRCLTSGMQSLGVRIARGLNRLWKHTGPVFAERYHARSVATPTEVRHALAYVLNNARKHGIFGDGPDSFSSGPWFDGWSSASSSSAASSPGRARAGENCAPRVVPTAAAHTWLLRVGWRRRGLIDWREIPGGERARRVRVREEACALESIQRSLAAAARRVPLRRSSSQPTNS
jgi:hypothetical protein